MKKIIVDTLGSDNGCVPIVKGALRAMEENPDIHLVFTGVTSDIEKIIKERNADPSGISIIHTEEFVPDDALPTCVFRDGDETSMVKSLEHLKNSDDCLGMISAGNTGALLVGTIFRLGLVPGLRQPALATALPCKKEGKVCLVDCGANTDCTSEDLKRYALMGNAFIKALEGIDNPKVALMSVGPSAHKGNALIKEAYPLIEALPINFIGNIEGGDLVNSKADVIVTDGFTGNVLLKNTEAAGMAAISVVESMGSDLPGYKEITEELRRMFAFNDRGGAVFLGASKTVVKMHGCATEDTAYACVNLVLNLESRNFSKNVAEAIKD
ncbi:MAG: hypothetical protein IKB50_00980 [Clostridia bacterium]|nr:hypothetical protein [Clostridia bacterium]